MKDLLIAGNRFTNEDIEKLQHIKSSIEVLKEDIDNSHTLLSIRHLL
jgi:hypothetical protein